MPRIKEFSLIRSGGSNAPAYVVSACLAGFHCKYDGGSNPCPEIVELFQKGLAIPVCPETLAALPSPRAPSEILPNGKVASKNGEDLSAAFERGAAFALDLALKSGCRKAILKSRSPSCGCGQIYDGTFTGNLRPGNGKWTEKLLDAGFEIWTEENWPGVGDNKI